MVKYFLVRSCLYLGRTKKEGLRSLYVTKSKLEELGKNDNV